MTPYVDPGRDPLSAITLAALEDLGWRGDYDAVDPYTVSAGAAAASADRTDGPLLVDEVVMPDVLMVVGEDGRLYPVDRR